MTIEGVLEIIEADEAWFHQRKRRVWGLLGACWLFFSGVGLLRDDLTLAILIAVVLGGVIAFAGSTALSRLSLPRVLISEGGTIVLEGPQTHKALMPSGPAPLQLTSSIDGRRWTVHDPASGARLELIRAAFPDLDERIRHDLRFNGLIRVGMRGAEPEVPYLQRVAGVVAVLFLIAYLGLLVLGAMRDVGVQP